MEPQQEENFSLEGFLNCLINNFMLYFLYVWLGGMTVAIVKGELTIELLTFKEDDKVKKKRKKNAEVELATNSRKFLEWALDWMPEKLRFSILRRCCSIADDEDDQL